MIAIDGIPVVGELPEGDVGLFPHPAVTTATASVSANANRPKRRRNGAVDELTRRGTIIVSLATARPKSSKRRRADAVKAYQCKNLIAVIEDPHDIRNIGTVVPSSRSSPRRTSNR
jgi:hypothetical protein